MLSVKLSTCCLMASVILHLALQCQCDAPTVCCPEIGCYVGLYMDGYQIEEFVAFLGIPYAFPPERFEPPVPYKSNRTHQVKREQQDCMQKNYLIPRRPINGAEDCLYLNVYKPKTIRKALPVMVYIFGGGFFAGSSSPIFVGPEYIMDSEDVILVTFGYRLGAFGFLSTGDEVMPGNWGLKDQALAIKWVFDNIVYFGGDRFRITLFGQSAGAVSAHMHMMSKLSQNYFSGVIAISGTANVAFAIDKNPEETFRQTCRYANVSDWDEGETFKLAEAIKKVPAYTLLNAGDHLKYWDVDPLVTYRPVVEKPSKTSFIEEHPKKILESGKYRGVPIMFGMVPNEGGVRVVPIMESEDLTHYFNRYFYTLMVKFLEFPDKYNKTQIKSRMKLITDEYFKGDSHLNFNTTQGFLDLVTDRGFRYPMYESFRLYLLKKRTYLNVAYMYMFNYLGSYTYANVFAGHAPSREYGVIHCDDLIYLFRAPKIFPDFDKNSTEAGVIKSYVENLVFFAHWRQPKINPPFKPCTYSTYYPGEGRICPYQEFTSDLKYDLVIKQNDNFDTERMNLWDRILFNV